MKITPKKLTKYDIDTCNEIQEWLKQFNHTDVFTAESLLLNLDFISRDSYSSWLLNKVSSYNKNPCAVYAVRKFPDNKEIKITKGDNRKKKEVECLWGADGKVSLRPAKSLGSEDLVTSIISIICRKNKETFLDHSSLNELRKKRIRNIILIDDSIGSGKRMVNYINSMTEHKTFLSWWNGGFIKIIILSYARTREAQKKILQEVKGSNHGRRIRRLSDKLIFDSEIIYSAKNLEKRWGNHCESISLLCNTYREIQKYLRRGFGNVMSNILFYHSVPNNIPGLLYVKRNNWKPLFPNRTLPEWLLRVFERQKPLSLNYHTNIEVEVGIDVTYLLHHIKKGIRKKSSLSLKMDCDLSMVSDLLEQSIRLGFVTENIHLTKTGRDYLTKKGKVSYEIVPNYSLYIPQSWCAD